MYTLIFDEDILNFIEKLPRTIQERIWKKLTVIKENPLLFFERLQGRSDYKLRIGDYRIIADIDIPLMKIEITRIGHRKNIYEDM